MQHLPSHPSPRTGLCFLRLFPLAFHPCQHSAHLTHPAGFLTGLLVPSQYFFHPTFRMAFLKSKLRTVSLTYLTLTKTKMSSAATLLLCSQTCHSLFLDTSPFTHPPNSTGNSYCMSNVTSTGVPFLCCAVYISATTPTNFHGSLSLYSSSPNLHSYIC